MHKITLFCVLTALPLATCAGEAFTSAASAAAATPGSAESSSSATFTGRNFKINVAGDVVQAKDGVLTVNGVPFGTLEEKSVVKYTVRGKEKKLTVNGAVREPQR